MIKDNYRSFVLVATIFMATVASAQGQTQAEKAVSPPPPVTKTKEKEAIPLLANVGFGLSQYTIKEAYPDRDGLIFGTELSIAVVAEKPVLERFKDKVPPKFRKAASHLGEVSVTSMWVPQTLYIQPLNDHREAYGATWGIVPKIGLGPSVFQLVVSGGVILTYLYHRDDRFPKDDQAVHFIRPGLRGGLGFQVGLGRYLQFEGGVKGDIYISQEFYQKQEPWNFTGVYGMVHFRVPFSVEAAL